MSIVSRLEWARKLLGWVRGEKHPNTPRQVFVNCYEYDRVRRVLQARCRVCGFVVSRDEEAVKEISFKCNNTSCCTPAMVSRSHQVCNACYDMHRALYFNPLMQNMNYFKEIDEKERAAAEDRKRKWGGMNI